jgi:predicted TIM-barrel fold metal-dependent hydrolase
MNKTPQLFSTTGNYGRGAYETPVFSKAEDLLSYMNIMGVTRSLVWHTSACDFNPTYGNRTLLKDIKDNNLEDRIVPALVIYPPSIYEEGAMDFLKESMEIFNIRALRIMPKTCNFLIPQIKRVLKDLVDFKPVLFWDVAETSNFHLELSGILELTAEFPDIPFVCTHPERYFAMLLDLLWQRKNIYIDNAKITMDGAIELMVDDFGPERVLFGLGPKILYGSSIASIMHADISKEEREMICHGNLERLLNLSPLENDNTFNCAARKDKPLWEKFRHGQSLENINIIDTHTHIGPLARGWIHKQTELKTQAEDAIEKMNRNGVQKMLVISEHALFGDPVTGNDITRKALEKYPDRFKGYFVYNPHYHEELNEIIEPYFESDYFIGFKILPSYWKVPVTDSRYEEIYEYANKYSLPILSHSWSPSYDSPALFNNIVKKYPDAVFIIGHSGGTDGRSEAVDIAKNNENVYLEFCGSFTSQVLWEDTFEKVGSDKVLFGSDTIYHSQAWELGRFLSIPIPDEKLIPALHSNALKILNNRHMD